LAKTVNSVENLVTIRYIKNMDYKESG